jgi:spore maturation protein CgeB
VQGGLNLRAFEIPAAGGFELVDEVPGLEEHFEPGSEMIAYKSPEHFRELADYYLTHPSERAAIIQRGRARVMRDHTYLQRIKVILDVFDRSL